MIRPEGRRLLHDELREQREPRRDGVLLFLRPVR